MVKRRAAVGWLLVALVAVAVAAAFGTVGAGATPQAKAYPRAQTLITSGTQWGNIAGMNPYTHNWAAGMVGLVNETLLRYDPLTGKYIPWLAKEAKWTGPKQFTVLLRPHVFWSDGKLLKGGDIAFNFNLQRFSTGQWNNLYQNLKLPIIVKGNGLIIFNFKSTPNYVQ